MYEAKILKIHHAGLEMVELMEGKEDLVENYPKLKHLRDIDTYFLHYQGWNSKWDEWVGIERVMEHSEENKQKKALLDQLSRRPKRTAAVAALAAVSATTDAKPNNKAESLLPLKGRAAPKRKRQSMVVLRYDDNIKHVLVDDWQFVTRDHQLAEVPAKVPVSQILEDYQREKGDDSPAVAEVMLGLKLYFDNLLHLMLLYKYENQQYFELLQKGVISSLSLLSDNYGLEHLLRLIVTMPVLLAESSMDAISLSVIVAELEALVAWLLENLDAYRGTYVNTTPQYDALLRQ